MNTLKQFYKAQVKQIAADIKVVKPSTRKLQSLESRGLGDSEEAKKHRTILNDNSGLSYLKFEARYLNLAYAKIRGVDLARVETNPRQPHDEKYLQKFMESKEKEFANLVAKTTSAAEVVCE